MIAYLNSGEVFEWDGHYTFDQLKDNPEKATEMNMESFYGKWIGKKVTLGQSKRRQCVKIQRLLHRLCGLKWFFGISIPRNESNCMGDSLTLFLKITKIRNS